MYRLDINPNSLRETPKLGRDYDDACGYTSVNTVSLVVWLH